jgi:hypothetical protein
VIFIGPPLIPLWVMKRKFGEVSPEDLDRVIEGLNEIIG